MPIPLSQPWRRAGRKTWRFLVAIHLYLGIALSLLFILWFASGIVMVYAGYPGTSEPERLARLPILDCRGCDSLPATLNLGQIALDDLRLGMWLDRPVYRIRNADRTWSAVDARTGASLPSMSDAEAADLVRRGFGHGVPRRVALHREPDQWLLSPPVQAQLPLLEFALHDSANSRVYVSARSGEVVLASTAGQRRWAWLGAVPHWLYFTALRRHLELWTQVVVWLSAAATVGVLTGLLLGLSRFRYRRRLESRRGVSVARSPFRERWMRWHHYLGLGFGLVVLTWVVSGLLSMNPGGWSPGMTPTSVDHQRWQGGRAEAATYRVSPGSAWHAAALEFPVGELRFVRVDGQAYYRAVGSDGRSRLVTAGGPNLTSVAELPQGTLLQAVRSVVPDGVVASAERLQEYDSYYYVQEGDRPPLPVYRFVFADRAHTRVYVDPAAARVVRVAGPRARLERWLYNGLHDLDFPGFINRRPLWDIVMIGLLLGGLTLSVTGTVLAWRRVRRWVVG